MSIETQCPGCGKKYALDDAHAGRKARCKQCGQEMRIPEASTAVATTATTATAAAATIKFRCDGCNKSYSTPANLAGKRITCKICGKSVKIPGTRVDSPSSASKSTPKSATNPTAKPSSKASLKLDLDGPPPADIFALDETPSLPKTRPAGDGILAEAPEKPGKNVEEDAPTLTRPGYTPLSEAKKKKIAKRAAKIDKQKASFSGAAVGVSFGSVLAIALFGWRIYRTVNRVSRIAGAADSAISAPADVNFDPKVFADQADKEAEKSIRAPGAAEAREWLDTAKYPNHVVFEMGNQRGLEVVNGFYERGAVKVYVIDPAPLGNTVAVSQFAVELPKDPTQRRNCFKWEDQVYGDDGEDPSPDLGQKYIVIQTD